MQEQVTPKRTLFYEHEKPIGSAPSHVNGKKGEHPPEPLDYIEYAYSQILVHNNRFIN